MPHSLTIHPPVVQAADRGVDGASVGAHTRTTSAEGGGASAEGEGEGGLEAAGEAVLTPNSAATVRREVIRPNGEVVILRLGSCLINTGAPSNQYGFGNRVDPSQACELDHNLMSRIS